MSLRALIQAVQLGDLLEARRWLDTDPGLAQEFDETGATAAHHAAWHGQRAALELLVARGADLNLRDLEVGATPAGWAIEYIRELGGYLGTDLDDFAFAMEQGDVKWVRRFLTRFPDLREQQDRKGRSFAEMGRASAVPEIRELFEVPV